MDRIVWIIIAVVALAVAGFFGFRASQTSRTLQGESESSAQLEAQLAELRAKEQELARQRQQEEDSKALMEEAARRQAEAEARRLAQAQAEREAQEAARQEAEAAAAKAAQAIERLRAEKAQIETEAARLRQEREAERAEAEAKLRAAQESLAAIEERKNAEIARQAALIETYSRQPKPTAPLAATPERREATQPSRPRFVFPADYKRGAHTLVPLLPGIKAEQEEE